MKKLRLVFLRAGSLLSRVLGLGVISLFMLAQGSARTSFTQEERANATAIDDDLAKQCQISEDQCRRTYAMLLFQAQMRFAEWGYGTKITMEPDPETTAAIRLYQQRNGLLGTGKIDGLTIVRMDADKKAVEAYPFTLPPFYFSKDW